MLANLLQWCYSFLTLKQRVWYHLLSSLCWLFFFMIFMKRNFFLPTFVKIGKMDGRLRNYIYFRVQNTVQISTDPRCLLKDIAWTLQSFLYSANVTWVPDVDKVSPLVIKTSVVHKIVMVSTVMELTVWWGFLCYSKPIPC